MQTQVDAPFEKVVDRTRAELESEGFGVLCEIDVGETLREHLDVEFGRYRILGACNPSLAHEALSTERTLGALLPCNVIVREDDDGDVSVDAIDPTELLAIADDPALDEPAGEVRARFERVLAALERY